MKDAEIMERWKNCFEELPKENYLGDFGLDDPSIIRDNIFFSCRI